MNDALGPTKPARAESVSETASATLQPSFRIPLGSSVLNDQHRLARVQAKPSGRTSDRASCLATMSTQSNNSPVITPTSASSGEGIVAPESSDFELDGSAVLDNSGRGLQQILTSAIQPPEVEFTTEGRKLCANSPAGPGQGSYLENMASGPRTPTVGDCNDNVRIGEPHLSTEAKLPKDEGQEVQSSPGAGSRAEVLEKKTDELTLGGWGEKIGVDAITAFPVYGTRKQKRSDARDEERGRTNSSAREKRNRERQTRQRSSEGDRGHKRRSERDGKPRVEVLCDFRPQPSKGGKEKSGNFIGSGLLGGLLTQLEEESREYTESDPPRKGRNTATGQARPNLDYVHSVVDNLIEQFSTRAVSEKPLQETPSRHSSRSRSLSKLFRKAAPTKTVSSPFGNREKTRRRLPSKRRQTALAASPNTSGVRISLSSSSLTHDKKVGLERVLSVCSLLESVTGKVTTETKKLRKLKKKSPALMGRKRSGNSTAVVEGLCGDLFKESTPNGGKLAGRKTGSKTMDIIKRVQSAKFVKPVGSKRAVKRHDSLKMLRKSGGSKQQVLQESGEVPVRVRRSLCGSVEELMWFEEEKDDSGSDRYTNAAPKRTQSISADSLERTKNSKKAWDDSEHTSPQKERNVHFVTNLIIRRRNSTAKQSCDSEPRDFPKESWGEVLWRKRKEEAQKKAPKKVLSQLGLEESMEDVDALSTETTDMEWSGNKNRDNSGAGRRATRLFCFQKAFAPEPAIADGRGPKCPSDSQKDFIPEPASAAGGRPKRLSDSQKDVAPEPASADGLRPKRPSYSQKDFTPEPASAAGRPATRLFCFQKAFAPEPASADGGRPKRLSDSQKDVAPEPASADGLRPKRLSDSQKDVAPEPASADGLQPKRLSDSQKDFAPEPASAAGGRPKRLSDSQKDVAPEPASTDGLRPKSPSYSPKDFTPEPASAAGGRPKRLSDSQKDVAPEPASADGLRPKRLSDSQKDFPPEPASADGLRPKRLSDSQKDFPPETASADGRRPKRPSYSQKDYTPEPASAAGGRAKRLSDSHEDFTPEPAERRSMPKGIPGKQESRATALSEISGGGSFDLEANEDLSQESQYSQFYPHEQRNGIDEAETPYCEGTESQGSLITREGEYRTGLRKTPRAKAYSDYRKNRSQDDLTSEWGKLVPPQKRADKKRPLFQARIGRRRSRLTSRELAGEEGGDVAQPKGQQSNGSYGDFQTGSHRGGSVRRISSDVLLRSQAGAPAITRVPPLVRTLSRGSVRIELELPEMWSRHPQQDRNSINPFVASGNRPFRSTSGYQFQRRSHRRGEVNYRHWPMVSHTALPAILPAADQLGPYIHNQQPTMPPYGLCSPPPLTSSPWPHWSPPPLLSYQSLTAPGVPMDSGLRFSQAEYLPHSRLPPAWTNRPPSGLTPPNMLDTKRVNVQFTGPMAQTFGLAEGTEVFPSPNTQGALINAVSAGQGGSAATTTKHGTSQSPVSQLCSTGKQSSLSSSAEVEPESINDCSNSESNVIRTWRASSSDKLDFPMLPALNKSTDPITLRRETTLPWRFLNNKGGQIALFIFLLVCAVAGTATGISMYSNRAESWDVTVNDGEVDGEQPPWMFGPWFKNDAALSEKGTLCQSPMCSEHVARLFRSLDDGVHPCQNFYGHVCSLKRSSSVANLQQAQETEHKVVAFFKGVGSPNKDLPVAAVSRRLWKDCVDVATLKRQGKAPLRALLKLADLGGWPFEAGRYDAATLPDVWKAAGKLQRLMALAPLIKIITLSDGTLWLTRGDPSGSVEAEDVLVAMMEAARRNVSRLRALAADVADLSHRLASLRERQPPPPDDHKQQGTHVLPQIFMDSAMKGLRRNVGLVRADPVGLVAATVKLVSKSSPQTVLNLLGYKLVRQVDLFTEAAVKADLNAGYSNRYHVEDSPDGLHRCLRQTSRAFKYSYKK